MRYGLTLPNMGIYSDVRKLAALASLAEEYGWDGFFLWDTMHYDAESQPVCDPWLALAVIAAQTARIKIGPLVAALTRRRPWKVARETVTLDHLSNGRLILGVGAGESGDRSFSAFGEMTDAKKRAMLFDESLTILQGLWSGQPFSHEGEQYHIQEITFLPRPLQTPRIPVWVSGTWPRKGPMARAARWDGVHATVKRADGSFTSLAPDEIGQLKALISTYRTTTSPFDIVVDGPLFAAQHDEQAQAKLQAYADAGVSWCLENIGPQRGFEDVRAAIRQGPPRPQH